MPRLPHEVLGVPRGADRAQIHKAFLAEARVCHPDKRPQGEAPEVTARMQRRFVQLHEAYETLMSSSEASGVGCGHLPEAFNVTQQQKDEVSAKRREAEEYLLNLRKIYHNACGWNEEDFRMFKNAWARALRAVETFLRQETEIKTFLQYSQCMTNDLQAPQRGAGAWQETTSQQTARRPPDAAGGDNGPPFEQHRGVVETVGAVYVAVIGQAQNVGAAFQELADDAMDFCRGIANLYRFAGVPFANPSRSGRIPNAGSAASGAPVTLACVGELVEVAVDFLPGAEIFWTFVEDDSASSVEPEASGDAATVARVGSE